MRAVCAQAQHGQRSPKHPAGLGVPEQQSAPCPALHVTLRWQVAALVLAWPVVAESAGVAGGYNGERVGVYHTQREVRCERG